MGAAQSKKRRRDRKRKKRTHRSGPYDFEISRSASVDVIQTLNLSAASCPLCRYLRQRNFSHSLQGSRCLLSHTCWRVPCHSVDSSRRRGEFDSCANCADSNYYLSPPQHPIAAAFENSTMSLNRNLTGRCSRLTQSKSSDFAEILGILGQPDDCNLPTENTAPHEQNLRDRQGTDAAGNMTRISADAAPEVSLTSTSKAEPNTVTRKKTICILEDEESRRARWERQKLMTQQLRNLRKHIQQQEAAGSVEHEILPFPLGEDIAKITAFNTRNLPSQSPPENETNDSDAADDDQALDVRRLSRSKFSKMSNYRFLDNHPILSKLQNEQNNRLESMERRMQVIRMSAMQEAERRKFAEIFPAKEDGNKNEELLQEAKETLERIKAEKRKKNLEHRQEQQQNTSELIGHRIVSDISNVEIHNRNSRSEEDSGDIIPVHFTPEADERLPVEGECAQGQDSQGLGSHGGEEKLGSKGSSWLGDAWPAIHLGNPWTWLLLPFLMFALLLRALMSLVISLNSSHGQGQPRGHSTNNPSTFTHRSADTRLKKL